MSPSILFARALQPIWMHNQHLSSPGSPYQMAMYRESFPFSWVHCLSPSFNHQGLCCTPWHNLWLPGRTCNFPALNARDLPLSSCDMLSTVPATTEASAAPSGPYFSSSNCAHNNSPTWTSQMVYLLTVMPKVCFATFDKSPQLALLGISRSILFNHQGFGWNPWPIKWPLRLQI